VLPALRLRLVAGSAAAYLRHARVTVALATRRRAPAAESTP